MKMKTEMKMKMKMKIKQKKKVSAGWTLLSLFWSPQILDKLRSMYLGENMPAVSPELGPGTMMTKTAFPRGRNTGTKSSQV